MHPYKTSAFHHSLLFFCFLLNADGAFGTPGEGADATAAQGGGWNVEDEDLELPPDLVSGNWSKNRFKRDRVDFRLREMELADANFS